MGNVVIIMTSVFLDLWFFMLRMVVVMISKWLLGISYYVLMKKFFIYDVLNFSILYVFVILMKFELDTYLIGLDVFRCFLVVCVLFLCIFVCGECVLGSEVNFDGFFG